MPVVEPLQEGDHAPEPCNSAIFAGLITGEIPDLTEDGLPSVGSAGHAEGTCKRCAFVGKGRCQRGKDCTHCHYDHSHLRSRRCRRSPNKGRESAAAVVIDPQGAGDVIPIPKLEGCSAPGSIDVLSSAKVDSSLVLASLTPALHELVPDVQAGSEPESEQDGRPASEPSVTQEIEPERESEEEPEGEWHREGDPQLERSSVPAVDIEPIAPADPAQAVVLSQGAVFERYDFASKVGLDVDALEAETSTPPISDTDDALAVSSAPSVSPGQSDTEPSSPLPASMPRNRGGKPITAATRRSGRLEASATSWATQQKLRRAETTAQSSCPGEVGRTARALLNKLTDERFEKLCEKVVALPLETPEHLAVVVSEIFAKATTERAFLPLYAELCLRLDSSLAPGSGAAGGKAFRRALIAECQTSFERHLRPADLSGTEHLDCDARYEQEVKLKTQRLGNMRFVGELLVRKLLALKLLPMITRELLDATTEPQIGEPALESLVALLTVVGPEFDQTTSLWSASLQEAFSELKRRSVEDAQLSMRLRCQVRDLLDLRGRGWPSSSSKVAAPPSSAR